MSRRNRADIQHNDVSSADKRSSEDVVDGMHEKLAELGEKRVAEEQPLEPVVRSNLRELVFLGGMRETIVYEGFQFEIKTLNNLETGELISDLSLYEIQDRGLALRTLALARSIIAVNGAPVETLYEGKEELSDMDKRVIVIDTWQNSLVNALFEKYEELMVRSKEIFSDKTMGDKVKN